LANRNQLNKMSNAINKNKGDEWVNGAKGRKKDNKDN
jgi:hypothetical protein